MILLVKSQIYVCTLIQQRVFSAHLNDPDQCWISNMDYNHTTVAPINTTISWYSERYATDRAVKKKKKNPEIDMFQTHGIYMGFFCISFSKIIHQQNQNLCMEWKKEGAKMKAKNNVWMDLFFPLYHSCLGHTCILLPANKKNQDFPIFIYKAFSSRIEIRKFPHPSKLSLIMFAVTDLNKTSHIQGHLQKTNQKGWNFTG